MDNDKKDVELGVWGFLAVLSVCVAVVFVFHSPGCRANAARGGVFGGA